MAHGRYRRIAWPSATFRLRAGNNRLRFCGVDVSPEAAGTIQTADIYAKSASPQSSPTLLSAAALTPVTNASVAINPAAYLGGNNAPGVLAFEAANEVWEGNSLELLVDVNGATLFRFKLPMAIDTVDHMYRWKGLRGICGGYSAITDWTREPPNLPDNLMNCGDLFFLHGFNVSEADARNWSRQMFKRLWLSGSRARFHGIAWYGDYNLAGSTFNGLHYHQDVYHALKTASAFKSYVEGAQSQSAKRVLMAHSLGNMMVSEALRQGLAVGKYFMFNAAVASEALDGSSQNADAAIASKYVPPDWNGYTNLCWSANWHKWFHDDSTDARGKMGWPDYFSAALNNAGAAYNYYSSGDLVFMETETPPGVTAGLFHWPTLSLTWPLISLNITEEAYSWQKQETHKGVDPLAGTLHGGWGFHCWEETVEGEPEFVMHSAAAANAMVEDGSVTNDPVFSIAGTQLNNRNATQDDIWLSLAKHVPAVSSPVGGMATLGFEDHDLNGQSYREGWGRQGSVYNQNWLHSDMKDMPFFFVYPFYDELVQKGVLK